MYRGGEEFKQSDALEKETATWMIDNDVLRKIAKDGVKKIIVFVQDTGDFYASSIELWLDRKIAKDVPTPRFGECRHLGIHLMKKMTKYSALTLQRT